jgi:VWFA-related protein
MATLHPFSIYCTGNCSRLRGSAMLNTRLRPFTAFALAGLVLTGPLWIGRGLAQQAPAPVPAKGDFVLHAVTRLVVEDVLVTDIHGNPVLGLPESAFHITDDGRPQAIRNFEETQNPSRPGAGMLKPAGGHGDVSSEESAGSRGSMDVLLLDPIGMQVEDQMYLRLQARQYIHAMPTGTAFAVFRTSAHGPPLLVQSFTEDKALLAKAIDNSVPTFATPVSSPFANALVELSSMARYLEQYSGRKSLIWFAGTFPLYEPPGGNGGVHTSDYNQKQEELREVDRGLERARIAVYPIDARGVVNVNLTLNRAHNSDINNPEGDPNIAGEDGAQRGAWAAMEAVAAATGGHAYYSSNDLAQELGAAIALGRHAYTLSYSPSPYTENGAYHRVKLTVDGAYGVSYRIGYYADQPGENGLSPDAGKGDTIAIGEPVLLAIPFTARVEPASTGNSGSFVVRYSISARDLSFVKDSQGLSQSQFKVAALAYNNSGEVVSSAADTVSTHYSAAQLALAGRVGVPALQTIAVAHGARYLLLSVVDLASGRTGTAQLTIASAQGK